ncbi:conserved hypothetical protein [Ricinus communis]|uniref:RNase H type-1 domain-containing protein n=1 Tax=Ricinus communis TaxID=3988 RepID=B9RFV9_RICCO|nr:conserved hypothetical protein [Ricinus communis]
MAILKIACIYLFAVLTLIMHGRLSIWRLNLDVWKQRNNLLWTGACTPVLVSLSNALSFLHQWRRSRATSTVLGSTRTQGTNEMKIGMAAVVSDSNGTFVACMAHAVLGLFEPRLAEAVALKEAIRWAIQMRFSLVVFESDSKIAVDAIRSLAADWSEFGIIIDECRSLLSLGLNFQVYFVKRQANMVAHVLAMSSYSYASLATWNVIPSCVEAILFQEASFSE